MLQPHSVHTTADGACAARCVLGAPCRGPLRGAPLCAGQCVVRRCGWGGYVVGRCVWWGAPVMSWSVAACTLESFFVIARFSDLSLQP